MGAIGGIVGDADKNSLGKMSHALRHRGKKIKVIPDSDVGFFCRSAQEEFWSGCLSEGNRLITYTGEMYNFKHPVEEDMIESVTESLASTADPDVFRLHDLLDGVYAFGFYDAKKKLLGLARDYAGYCPLYYFVSKNRIFFASEIKSILAALDEPVELDYDVLGRYLMYGHCPGLRTLFAGIRRVPPSSVLFLNLKDHSTKLLTYGTSYEPPNFLTYSTSEKDLCARIYEELRNAVIRRTRIGGSPYGVFLSGGVDSSFLTAILKQVSPGNVIAYTAIFSEQEFDRSNARIVTDSLGIEHNLVLIKPEDVIPTAAKVAYIFDDLVGNPNTLVPGFLLSEEASKEARSIFTADGSDVLFGLSTLQKAARTIERMINIPANIRRSSSIVLKKLNLHLKVHLPQIDRMRLVAYSRWYKNLLEASLANEANRPTETILKGFFGRYFDVEEIPLLSGRISEDPARSIRNEIQTYFDVPRTDTITKIYCAIESMTHTDDNGPSFNEKLSGYFGVPSRLPMKTDHKLRQLAASIPWELKVPSLKPSQTKYIWRKTIRLHTSLPLELVNSKHRGMSANPITKWLLSDLRADAESLIVDSLQELHLDKKYVARRLRKGIGREIRVLLMLSLWYEHYQKMLT